MLPHLRHNPIVRHIRHALALHEKRAWFKATTWGQLDNDRKNAMKRVHDRTSYDRQDIREVWFTGCHSDVGAGEIALRWMVGEALGTGPGLGLSPTGHDRLHQREPAPETHESSSLLWRLTEMIPRLEIFNDGVWPKRRPSWGSNGARQPQLVRRDLRFSIHATAADRINTVNPAPPAA
jgi:hypothetical protein